MEIWVGNIWNLVTKEDAIVIPTNIGWRRDGSNVMGRGLAKDAAKRWKNLPKLYGQVCQQRGVDTGIVAWEAPKDFPAKAIVLFPTKHLYISQPQLSWQNKSSISLIDKSAVELNVMVPAWPVRHVLVPVVGCGNGGLDSRAVIPLLHRTLTDPKCVLLMRQNDVPIALDGTKE